MGCSGSMNFLQIPGNIKQNFAPFVLDPSTGINQAAKSSPNVSGAPQKFSFKEGDGQSVGRIGMFPHTIWQSSDLFLKDLSFSSMGVSLNDLLWQLPCVQIREYLPDTKLDQTLNFFSDMFAQIFRGKDFKNATKDLKEDQEDSDSKKSSSSLIDRLKNVVNVVLKTIESQSFMDTIAPNDAPGNPGKQMDQIYSYIVKFPYMVYYTLQSCVTTNIYELPCVPSNNFLHSSDGKPGWCNDSATLKLMPDLVKHVPIVGKMIAGLFDNMRINMTPWWNSEKGSETMPPEIELKFSLFNDNLETAIVNFVFINTILQNNRWIQYHIFQHSSSLYDVVIGGIGAYRACMGQIDVQYKGMLREPSTAFFNGLKSRVGPRYNGDALANSRLIRIPDVYDVTLKFQSLLPQNFNTFLFNYMSDDQMTLFSGASSNVQSPETQKYIEGKDGTLYPVQNTGSVVSMATYQPSGLGNFQSAIKKVLNNAIAEWKKG